LLNPNSSFFFGWNYKCLYCHVKCQWRLHAQTSSVVGWSGHGGGLYVWVRDASMMAHCVDRPKSRFTNPRWHHASQLDDASRPQTKHAMVDLINQVWRCEESRRKKYACWSSLALFKFSGGFFAMPLITSQRIQLSTLHFSETM
jgi:hypothetical protein